MNQLLLGVILAMSVGGYFYYSTTEAKLLTLQAENQAYELRDAQQKEAITSLQNSYAVQTAALLDVQAQSQEIQAEMDRYLDIFKRHNLTKLAAAKPGLIETRANAGTKEVFDGIEADSASIDSLDDGVQLAPGTITGSTNSN